MSVSLLNGFLDFIKSIVDIIPKMIYLLYASLTSCIDVLQNLVRKLAGLDVYYQNGIGSNTGDHGWSMGSTTQNAIRNRDPLSDFIMGILGLGDNAPLYQAVNNVFWSLAVFGLIMLVLSTMVAIIKSHYNEDAGATSPWKYIYTAIKAVLTFAIMPVVVVIGFSLSSFLLRTLDNITAGGGSEQEVVDIYGPTVVQNKLKGTEVDGKTLYSNYDYFGAGSPTQTTTFSGMLFGACTYTANRARNGSFSVDQLRLAVGNGSPGGFFGASDSGYANAGESGEAKLAYMADQIDYAFKNHLVLKDAYSYGSLKKESPAYVNPLTDIVSFTVYGEVKGFSKFDTATIWLFYDLWGFNFIVGFGAIFVVLGIMIGVIIGLMSRLIKGALLFLIYPALLGLAPIDDFKAFKSCMSDFVKQLMMAFGAIIGMNLLMLILPLVQNISFFNIAVIDAIVNTVIIITGLMMLKEFIGMVSGFAGGENAASTGEGLKGNIAGTFKQGAAWTMRGAKLGVATAKFGVAAGKKVVGGTVKAGKRIAGGIRENYRRSERGINRAEEKANRLRSEKFSEMGKLGGYKRRLEDAETDLGWAEHEARNKASNKDIANEARRVAEEAAGKKKMPWYASEEDRQKKIKEAGDKAEAKAWDKILNNDEAYSNAKDQVSSYRDAKLKQEQKLQKAKAAEDKLVGNYRAYGLVGNSKTGYSKDASAVTTTGETFGSAVKGVVTDGVTNAASAIGDGIVKGWDKAKEGAGKLLGQKEGEEFGDAVKRKLNESLSVSGAFKDLIMTMGETAKAAGDDSGISKGVKEAITQLKGMSFKPQEKKYEGDALAKKNAEDQKKRDDALLQATQDVGKNIDKLAEKLDKLDGKGGSGSGDSK